MYNGERSLHCCASNSAVMCSSVSQGCRVRLPCKSQSLVVNIPWTKQPLFLEDLAVPRRYLGSLLLGDQYQKKEEFQCKEVMVQVTAISCPTNVSTLRVTAGRNWFGAVPVGGQQGTHASPFGHQRQSPAPWNDPIHQYVLGTTQL